MRKLIVLFISALIMTVSVPSFANAPTMSAGVAEGYSVVFKNGVNSGAVNTRLHIIVGQKIADRLSLSVLIGVLTDNTVFKPMPRAAIMANMSLTDKAGISVAGLFQFNYDYGHGGFKNTHSISLGFAPTYKLSDQLTGALFVSVGKTLGDESWIMAFQPGVTYRF